MAEGYPTLELAQNDGRPTLELFKHDETARAPERDKDTTAFELDASCLAPEVLPGTGPQLLYRNSLPEVVGSIEKSAKSLASPDTPKPILKQRWLLITLVITAAIAIGVGVGVWHTKRKGSSGTSSSTPNPPTPHTPTNTSTAQYILNDTSLAAAILPNGDRHLYFQDSTGLIRYVVRTATTSRWDTFTSLNITSGAKIHTPLTVSSFKASDGSEQIQLFYVSRNHQLSGAYANSTFMVWQNDDSLANYTTAPNTRSLSVTSNSQGISNRSVYVTTTLAVLFYESPNTSVAVLSRVAKRCSAEQCPGFTSEIPLYPSDNRGISWIDNTPTLSESYLSPSGSQCQAPFTSGVVEEGANFSVAAFFRQIIASEIFLPKCRFNFQENTEKPTFVHSVVALSDDGSASDVDAFQKSDLVVMVAEPMDSGGAIYINNTEAKLLGELDIPLKSAFPFARMASVAAPDNQTNYLYHQINGTTFAEEVFESSVQKWGDPTYINVSPSSS